MGIEDDGDDSYESASEDNEEEAHKLKTRRKVDI
jgi:hypothetical protein